MKIITIQKIGYNHPSQANWSYGIWNVSTIDTDGCEYQMSYTTKESFGGDSRFRNQWKDAGVKVIELKAIYPEQKITGISKMIILDGKEFETIIAEFINK
jgi:hypothetical protein